ncbi:transposase InsO family protein [Pseudomonas fluorescens]
MSNGGRGIVVLIKALDMAYEQRVRSQGTVLHSDQGSRYGS